MTQQTGSASGTLVAIDAERGWMLAAALLSLLIGVAYYLSAPLEAGIRWPDSPRHALNGAFVYDAMLAFPWQDPLGWADAYYNQYPALTFGFYPPLPSMMLVPFYAVFGVSTASSVGLMAACMALLCFGLYSIGTRLVSPLAAIAGVLFLAGAHEVLIWGRQMMLETPMMMFVVGSLLFFMRYLDSAKAWELVLSAALMVAALYVKQTAGIYAVAMIAIGLWTTRGAMLARPHVWIVAAIAVVAMVPLVLLQLKFAAFNVITVVERTDIGIDRNSWDGVLFYPLRFVEITNVPFVVASIVGAFWLIVNRRRLKGGRDWMILALSLVVGLVALWVIALKEPRHATPLLIPLALFAAAGVQAAMHLVPARAQLVGAALAVAAAGLLAYQLTAVKVQTVDGPQEAADWVMAHMPEGGPVALSVSFDGPFIFRMRQHDPDRRFFVTRVDKMLLDILIMPELGLNPQDKSDAEIRELLDCGKFRYVVLEPRDFMSAPVMQRFKAILQEAPFRLVATIPATTYKPKSEVLIYENTQIGACNSKTIRQAPSVL